MIILDYIEREDILPKVKPLVEQALDERKILLHYHIPRTGGMAVRKHLRTLFGQEYYVLEQGNTFYLDSFLRFYLIRAISSHSMPRFSDYFYEERRILPFVVRRDEDKVLRSLFQLQKNSILLAKPELKDVEIPISPQIEEEYYQNWRSQMLENRRWRRWQDWLSQ